MGTTELYSTFYRLAPAGTYRILDRPHAQAFLQAQWSEMTELDSLTDEAIQTQLIALMGELLTEPQHLAQLCLRCFISQQIVYACTSLVNQFGTTYRFHLADLLPFVLDDDGRIPMGDYPSLAKQILDTFQPTSGTLRNWSIRLVRQHPEVSQFLLEQGLYLISDWAILNDTPIDRLQRILPDFYQLSSSEVQQACALLDSYRAIYLADRLQQSHKDRTRKRQCPPPTPEQLQRMCDRLQQHTHRSYAPEQVMKQLSSLANQLRQHRIAVRTGRLPTQPIDTPVVQAAVDSQSLIGSASIESDETRQIEFLQRYRQLFLQALDCALETVVQDRLAKAKQPEKADRFLRALDLFYCQRYSMTEIAKVIGVPRQDNVTYLLKLKELRADVRNLMLKFLRDRVAEIVPVYCEPDRLNQLSQSLEEALNEQIDQLIQAEAKRTQTSKEFMKDSLFAQRLCQYLDRLLGKSTSS